jgi:Type II secretion system (T2SS), protein E, N-terminal domain
MNLQELCTLYGVPSVQLDSFQPNTEAIKLLSLNLATKWNVLPLSKIGCTMTLVVENPLALPTIDAVRFHTGLLIEVVVAPAEEIAAAILRFYSVEKEQIVVECPKQVRIRTERLANALVQSALKSPHIHVSSDSRGCYEVEVPAESSAELFKQALRDLTEEK